MSVTDTVSLEIFLSQLISSGVAPGVVAAVCSAEGEVFSWVGGSREVDPSHLPMKRETLFDLASLTKVVSVTTLTLLLHERGVLDLNDRISKFFPDSGNFSSVRIVDILSHTAGFIAEERLWDILEAPEEVLDYILHTEPLGSPGTYVTYSCFGFIILGFLLEKVLGISLAEASNNSVFKPLKMEHTLFCPLEQHPQPPAGYAATERDEKTGSMLRGVVHDENARFLGGIAGNAGCFSTIDDLLKFTQMLLSQGSTPEGRQFLSPESIGLFSRALHSGAEEVRSIGYKIIPLATGNPEIGKCYPYGHTGFTGTSIWIDPIQQVGAILLSNRVHPSRVERRLIAKREEFYRLASALVR